MYTVVKNTQIVIALLKEYGIKHIVISPGTRNGPFVHSVEEDSYFKCYSVVDERSAGFFAIGIAKQLNEPVVISCTSSTASCNYYSAVTEAYYSHIPLVVLSSDRDPRQRNQLEKQQIEQAGIYGKMCRKAVDLPLEIHNDVDFWYCQRLVNEALLELNRGEGGPVQINMPAYFDLQIFTEPSLPKVNRIHRNLLLKPYTEHEIELPKDLCKVGKIMLVIGSCAPWTEERRELLRKFAAIYDCAIVAQHMSNLGMDDQEVLYPMAGTDICNCFAKDMPSIMITLGGPSQLMLFDKLRKVPSAHWHVNAYGEIQDPSRQLTEVFECSIDNFLSYFIENAKSTWASEHKYETALRQDLTGFWESRPELTLFSNIYVIQEFCKLVPENAVLSMSILNAIRGVETFPVPKNTEVYANVGAYGIDGCMSTFLGQACVTDKPAYLVIGDLSFIYDMNSIWIRHVGNNVHILLVNNYEGIEMHRFFREHGDLRRHITAGHHASPRGWIEENGFHYYTASTKEELIRTLPEFMNETEKCILEVFTNEPDDTKEALRFYSYQTESGAKLKETVRQAIGTEGVYKIKKILRKK